MDGLRKPLGRRAVALGRKGSRAKDIKRRGLLKNPHHGALQGLPEEAIVLSIEVRLDDGRLVKKGRKYPNVRIPDKRVRVKPAEGSTRSRRPKHPGLAGTLSSWRRRTVRRLRWKPYQVFPDKTLVAIAAERQSSLGALAKLPGMGPKRRRSIGRPAGRRHGRRARRGPEARQGRATGMEERVRAGRGGRKSCFCGAGRGEDGVERACARAAGRGVAVGWGFG